MSSLSPSYDYLIVGSGLFGATFARLATDAGLRCLVIDKRLEPGGNVRCLSEGDIDVHLYGPHIFHTSNEATWEFVNRYCPMEPFVNTPLALAPDGKLYPLPFNMHTFNRLWGCTTPAEAEAKLKEQQALGRKMAGLEGEYDVPSNLEQQALVNVGPDIYRLLIEGYTRKQWGRPCCELPASIIKRLPLRLTYNNNYFNDIYQGIPAAPGGYNTLIDALLEGSDVRLGVDFFYSYDELRKMARKVVYTGPLDEYFRYSQGHLEWRSLRFESQKLTGVSNYQGTAVINNTSADVSYTRTIEHRHFTPHRPAPRATIITREYPAEWTPSREPYYPVNDAANERLAAEYRDMAAREPDTIFGGRLATYRYLDMAPVIESAINAFTLDHQHN